MIDFTMNKFWILLNAISASNEMIVHIFSFILVM